MIVRRVDPLFDFKNLCEPRRNNGKKPKRVTNGSNAV